MMKASVKNISIGMIWLVQVSGLIGISLGYQEWFIVKTPYNLLLGALVLIINFPINSRLKWLLFIGSGLVGMIAEWLGVNYGLMFGEYSYGTNLGLKIWGVPLLIGVNWAVLCFITAALASKTKQPIWIKAAIGAALMVFLDYFMEFSAPGFDFWQFSGEGATFINYRDWFVVAYLLHLAYHKLDIKGDSQISFHLYGAQLLFFAWFYVFYHL